jgi:hypothetical protein
MKWFAFVCTCAVAALGIVSTQWAFAQDAPAIAPVMKTDRMMKVFSDPIIDALKAAVKEAPATPKGWRVIQDQGEAAAEVANLTMMRVGEHENTPEWDQLADAMKKAGLALADAASKKDFVDVQAKFLALIKNCNECHKKFEPDDAPEILP